MKDGSNVTLNTDSAIRVALSPTQREVQLDHGEAFFEVAKDPNRPFIVNAGDKRVIAVGTKFSVRRIDDEIRVFVTEGKVRVEDRRVAADSTSSVAAGEVSDRQVLLAAGGIARARDDSILVRQNALPEIENYLSWRTGYLTFTETPLADAVAEFNRYNNRKIVIADPQVAAIRIGGKFRATNVEVFVRLLTDGYPIDAQSKDDQIIFRERRSR
jgi:transmembrane sensor